jgi:hypothetical protein
VSRQPRTRKGGVRWLGRTQLTLKGSAPLTLLAPPRVLCPGARRRRRHGCHAHHHPHRTRQPPLLVSRQQYCQPMPTLLHNPLHRGPLHRGPRQHGLRQCRSPLNHGPRHRGPRRPSDHHLRHATAIPLPSGGRRLLRRQPRGMIRGMRPNTTWRPPARPRRHTDGRRCCRADACFGPLGSSTAPAEHGPVKSFVSCAVNCPTVSRRLLPPARKAQRHSPSWAAASTSTSSTWNLCKVPP